MLFLTCTIIPCLQGNNNTWWKYIESCFAGFVYGGVCLCACGWVEYTWRGILYFFFCTAFYVVCYNIYSFDVHHFSFSICFSACFFFLPFFASTFLFLFDNSHMYFITAYLHRIQTLFPLWRVCLLLLYQQLNGV